MAVAETTEPPSKRTGTPPPASSAINCGIEVKLDGRGFELADG